MKTRLQSIVGLVLFLIAGSAFAQSITVPTVSVAKGDTAVVTLGYTPGGNTTNLDFTMAYDETVVDETAITADCSAATAIGLTVMQCSVDMATNTVKGIGVNFTGNLLTLGDFATVNLPVLSGAPAGDSTNAFDINFSASGTVTTVNTTWTLTVLAADQTISGFAADPASGAIGGSSSLSATASSGLPVTFGSATLGICSVAGGTVTYLATGTCTVTADQAGDADYNAAPQVTLGIGVGLASQTITSFVATPSGGVVGGSSALTGTASSGLTVTFSSLTPGTCSVTVATVNYLAEGTCTVAADQVGNEDFSPAAQVTLNLAVSKADQTITGLAADPAAGVVDGTSALSATASSGLAVSFGSSTLGICTVSGSTVTYLAAGTCTVTADQAGDDDYNAAPQVTLGIVVGKADQTITGFAADPANGTVDGTSTLSATASSGLAVTFGSSTPAICTVAGSTVTFIASGTCMVTADQAGDDDYNAASQVTLDIGIDKTDQTITGFAADPATGVIDGTSALSATASSGLTVAFGSSTPGVCSVAGSTVTYLTGGTCTVTADQAGDADYNAAPQVTLDIGIDKTDQTITGLAADPAAGVVDETSALSATASSGLTVDFGSSTPAVCVVVDSTVIYLAAGTCTVTADQAGDDNYNAATQVSIGITVAMADQVITNFTALPDYGYIDGTSTLNASGGGSSEPVIYGSNTPLICIVVDSTVAYIAAGTCTVTADQAGDDDYNAAPQVTLDIDVTEFAPIQAEPIPTLSQWGLALLFLLMLSMGGIVIRRKDAG